MKLAHTAILAALLLSGAPALAQIHNGTDGVAPYSTPDPNAPGNLRSGTGPMFETPSGPTTGSGSGTSSSSGAQSAPRPAPAQPSPPAPSTAPSSGIRR